MAAAVRRPGSWAAPRFGAPAGATGRTAGAGVGTGAAEATAGVEAGGSSAIVGRVSSWSTTREIVTGSRRPGSRLRPARRVRASRRPASGPSALRRRGALGGRRGTWRCVAAARGSQRRAPGRRDAGRAALAARLPVGVVAGWWRGARDARGRRWAAGGSVTGCWVMGFAAGLASADAGLSVTGAAGAGSWGRLLGPRRGRGGGGGWRPVDDRRDRVGLLDDGRRGGARLGGCRLVEDGLRRAPAPQRRLLGRPAAGVVAARRPEARGRPAAP